MMMSLGQKHQISSKYTKSISESFY